MLKPKTRWICEPVDVEKKEKLAEELSITPLVASLLVKRGIDSPEDANSFLFEKELEFHDPFILLGMDIAVSRIKEAITNNEPILIFGDYDADGVTSTSVMMITLRELGANVQYYIPNRFTEGYGPNEQAFRYAADNGVRLIITVDTGIAAVHEAQVAKELGLDLIITDHHEPGPELPEAIAIIHPKLEDSPYPFRELAGVGVAFKLAHALLGKVPEHLLEFAAIGTIADLVPLKDENRLIAKRGIRALQKSENHGLKALLKLAGTDISTANEETIGFALGPRINAAGRLDSADIAVELLLTEDASEAETIAEEIDALNKERQAIVTEMAEEAIKEVEENFPIEENPVIVVGKAGWNAGVIGIVASKLVDRFYRPAIVLSYDEEKGLAKGSARSIAGFDLFQNLSTCREILPHFGGHPMAAGMTLKIEDVPLLRSRLNQLAGEQLTEDDFIPVTKLDSEVDLRDVNLAAIEEMQMLAPFGMHNPKPRVLIKEANIAQIKKIGADQNHLKLMLEDQGNTLDGVGFGLGALVDEVSSHSKLAAIGELAINEWNNIRKPQIFLQDLAVHEWQLFDYRGLKRVEKLSGLVSNGKWILFNEKNAHKVAKEEITNAVFINSIEEAKALEISDQNIVLLDLPPSKEILNALIEGKSPARIYAHFHSEESDYFSTMPTREHFKWYYAFLTKKAPFDLKKYGDDLAKHRGWTRATIDFMSEVFLELDFINQNNGFITLNQVKNKKDLSESITYQQKQAHYALEGELLYSSVEQLKEKFDQMMHGSVNNEEAVEKWI
ncbi:single-stranded-DNA-specific exonuclease RecJ [Robertmurraya kyonggiensis]|uniref:Single-stranded-DNA-specific exonuclease RecJ n=1 Tax=Robertmurraya kyonggiensis TaxID=1037680 RepID=A0A4U1DC04_9BACI|nr:single-stranded-DNA-specific exonuclease RecJ [Robertmurraya kyonggiensis]TKC20054.1 single-stranded-DNA-specific exonuclease RecJ [Robertmurraya kyonggiensis]